MFTSCYGRAAILPPELTPIAISQGLPREWKGARELRLAPPWALLKSGLTIPEFAAAFRRQLAQLDPCELAADLGPAAVLLCWEPPGFQCHRRIVAEWLEQATGQAIPEYGYARELVRKFDELPPKGAPPSAYPWLAPCDYCHKSNRVLLGAREHLCAKCGMYFPLSWE